MKNSTKTMTLLPFDIETGQLAVKAGTGRIVTRSGYPVEIDCWDTMEPGDDWPVEGTVIYPDVKSTECWTKEGRFSFHPEEDRRLDLFIETYLDL